MGTVRHIADKLKKFLSSPIYSTIILVPLLLAVVLLGAVVFMFVENAYSDRLDAWTYLGAVYYCMTVVTTIGYGIYTPVTVAGKILTMLYILISIPLTVLTLAKVGQFLTLLAKVLWNIVCSCIKKKNAKRNAENISLPLIIPVLILVIYILLGSLIFWAFEDWSYLDSVYFVFVSLSTIGFGDLCPLNSKGLPIAFLYILGGMMIIAMCINVTLFDVVKSEEEKDKTATKQIEGETEKIFTDTK